MALDNDHFVRTLLGLQQLGRFAKPLGEAGLMLAWASFPEQAKSDLSNAAWTFAAAQYVLDPEPPKGLPVHIAMLRYLYRNRDGVAALDWGLKPDLASRMKLPGYFHRPTVSEHERLMVDGKPALDGPRQSTAGVLRGAL